MLARVGSATLDLGALRTAWADTLSGDMQRAALRRVVQNWIEDQLLAQEAVRRGLAEDPAIDHELERLRSQLLANVALERLLPDTFRVSEEEIRAYYEANRDAYRRTEDEVRVQQILVSQRFLAQEIYDRASQGEDFAALAKQYSQGPLAERGGDVGFVPVSYLPEKLRRAVVAARPGSLLRPLPLEDGFLVVKVLALAPAGSYRELDEVRPRIEMELKRRKHEEAYRRLIQELSSRTDVWVNEALLGSDTAGQGSTP
ncbi:MAG: peptidyl-prolyl cis-trans isomerase [candidate division KSB1 bacterium]|nr:peptidyl-prolyl cis-trans isomerase [candidate division KSB1 bacterium]